MPRSLGTQNFRFFSCVMGEEGVAVIYQSDRLRGLEERGVIKELLDSERLSMMITTLEGGA